jgi:hypothetical protein
MNEEHARDFWERALDEIQDDGFFAPVSTAEPPPLIGPPTAPARRGPRFSVLQLVLMVVATALVLALIVVVWLAPALYF